MAFTPIMGNNVVNTVGQLYPNNATVRPNTINGKDLKNSIGSFPVDMNQGLTEQLKNIRLMSDTFEDILLASNTEDYRSVFEVDTIPLHSQTFSKVYTKFTGIDENPLTAAVEGLLTWQPIMNEVAMQGSSVEVTTHAYGRFYKKHRLSDDISMIDWMSQLAKTFGDNMIKTMNNLAGIRLYEGANKIYVSGVAAFNPQTPNAARATLTTDASKVAGGLTWEHLKIAKYLMQNYKEHYTVVNQSTGAREDAVRNAVIPGYQGEDNYLVLVGANGYNQLMNDPQILQNFVINGGVLQQAAVNNQIGIGSPVQNFIFRIVRNTITISKEATPKVSVTGEYPLECAFVIGGASRIGIELTLQGSTQLITVGYDEDKKVDPFGLYAMTGWFTITDFSVINNEALYCIPYEKSSPIVSGSAQAPTAPNWKK